MAEAAKSKGRPGVRKAGTSAVSNQQRKVLFIAAMLANGLNQTHAAIAAGAPARSAANVGHFLMKDVEVKAALQAAQDKAKNKHNLTEERVLSQLSRIVNFDPRKLFDEKGELKLISELDDETASAIASIEVTQEFEGKGKTLKLIGYTKKIKAWDKNAAIDKAMKHLGLFERDNEQQVGKVNVDLLRLMPTADLMALQGALLKLIPSGAEPGRVGHTYEAER